MKKGYGIVVNLLRNNINHDKMDKRSTSKDMFDSIQKLHAFIDDYMKDKDHVRILEGGCGSASHIKFQKGKSYITGIDISEKQLSRNSLLNEKILGDIQTYDFRESSFDVIVCWDVLEHLTNPEMAIQKFVNAIKPNGIIILKAPNPFSLKGLTTKFLPHRLHIYVYKFIFKRKNAGRNEEGPFKTYMRFSMSPQAIKKIANENGLEVNYFNTHDVEKEGVLVKRNKLFLATYKIVKRIFWLTSFGKLADSEFVIILRKI